MINAYAIYMYIYTYIYVVCAMLYGRSEICDDVVDDADFGFLRCLSLLSAEGTLGHCQEICHWPKMPRNRFSVATHCCCNRVIVVVVVDNHSAWPNANAERKNG